MTAIFLPVPSSARGVGWVDPTDADLAAIEDDWRNRARCAEVDAEIFFPEKGGSTAPAKMVCRGCEVRATCLELALENRELHGIYGGLSPRERRRLLRSAAA